MLCIFDSPDELSAPPGPLAAITGGILILRGRNGREKRGGRQKRGKGKVRGLRPLYLNSGYGAFSDFMLLVGRQEGHPACKKTEWCGAGMVICLQRVQTCVWPS